jgi:hypothetical protein
MDEELIHISFEGVDATQAAEYAQELTDYLREVAPEVEVSRVRDDTRAQDFGASLVLIFAGAAATTLVNYLRHKFAKDLVVTKQGLVEAQKELVEAQLDYEKLKREPLKKLALRKGGEVVVGYASPQLVSVIKQLVNKTKK